MSTPRKVLPAPPKMSILYYNGNPLFIYPVIAKRFGLAHGGQVEDDEVFIRLVHENAYHYTLVGLAKTASSN